MTCPSDRNIIRFYRTLHFMTQTELAGNDITRNMLSRIETGAALPELL